MDDHEETSATSPSMLNILNTASNLPLELLQLIFNYYTKFKDLPVGSYHACPAWIVVTHVCRRWRAAALNYSLLWTVINIDTLGKGWVKAFMERSNPSLIDVTLRINHVIDGIGSGLTMDELFSLFAGCTRLRSLHIISEISVVCKLLDTLHTATHIRSLSLDIVGQRPVELPDNLFGGQAPIREVSFIAARYIVAPQWLLRGVTHFTSNQRIPLQNLLDTLGQMHVLHSFTLERCVLDWKGTDAPRDVQIPMQNLMYFTVDVDAGSPFIFALLYRRLALPEGAKKMLRSHKSSDWQDWKVRSDLWSRSVLAVPLSLRDVIIVANGLRQAQFSGGYLEGSFRVWTGDYGYEDAEFSFEISWKGDPSQTRTGAGSFLSPVVDLVPLCDLLGVERVHTLTLLLNSQDPVGLGVSFWWTLLKKLPAVEELELCVDSVRELRSAWSTGRPPAVFPGLRGIRIARADNSTASSVAEMTEELTKSLQGIAMH